MSGISKFQKIEETLSRHNWFWPAFHDCLDRVYFTDEFVESYDASSLDKRKFIKDNVWGMMEFSGDEIALIDSPLVQRLRGIYQLGFSYLTYPSAEHSRFSHTLGVTHVTKTLLKTVRDSYAKQPNFMAGGEQYELFDPSSVKSLSPTLVHAAILHDIGHFAFSHAGESAVKNSLDRLCIGSMPLMDLISTFREFGVTSDLSEIMSSLICLSPRFRKFYEKIHPEYDKDCVYI